MVITVIVIFVRWCNNVQKNKIKMKNLFIITLLVIISFINISKAEENKTISEHQYNFYTGNFDFSDDKQSAILVGF